MKNWLKRKMIWPVIGLVAFLGIAATNQYSVDYFEISKNLEIFSTLYKELNNYYVDEVDPSTLMREGIDAMLGSLDPYTNYISEADIEGYRLQTTGKYGGIGAMISKRDDRIFISEPYKDFPADKAGMKAGDEILSVDGKSTAGKSTEDVSKVLKGQPGTTVEVVVRRPRLNGEFEELTLDIGREEIKINNVPFSGMVDDNIGYIKLQNFTERAGAEVREALRTLKEENELKGVILDLRGNPGGLLNEAVNVSNVFIPKGENVVSTKGRISEWDKEYHTLSEPVDDQLPVAVLTNKGSASASEIVSGSIQDLDRGVVVGQKSFGKGLVQTTRSLTYNTKLKVTTAKYYIPSGRCIQAINYAERDDDGSVKRIPDSLKVAFETRNGRKVYDGGGIDPDIELQAEKFSNVTISLLRNNLLFDWATDYALRNESIASPREFRVTDQDFENFVSWLSDKEYKYNTQTEDVIKELRKIAKEEKYLDAIKGDLEAVSTNIEQDKNKDVHKNKDEIVSLLEEEIVRRYHYRAGAIETSFRSDREVLRAVKVLMNKENYESILASKE